MSDRQQYVVGLIMDCIKEVLPEAEIESDVKRVSSGYDIKIVNEKYATREEAIERAKVQIDNLVLKLSEIGVVCDRAHTFPMGKQIKASGNKKMHFVPFIALYCVGYRYSEARKRSEKRTTVFDSTLCKLSDAAGDAEVASLFKDVFATPPDFVNEQGVKWWLDQSMTDWAHRKDLQGTSLPDVKVWYVEEKDGTRTRLIIDGTEVEYANPSMEAIGAHIDMMKIKKRHSGSVPV